MSLAEPETRSSAEIADWIIAARDGSSEAVSRLMEFSRQYLLWIAHEELPTQFQAKAGVSDLVQDAQMEAAAAMAEFRGHSPAELLGWLRQILLNNVHDFKRRFTAEKRRISREVSLRGQGGGRSNGYELVADNASPSGELHRQERDDALEAALAELPDEYQQVIAWRHRDNASFEEIGSRLGRSAEAVRKLWSRAVRKLQERLGAGDESA